MLREELAKRGCGCIIYDEVKLGDSTLSSSRVRELIVLGKMEEAAEALGHPHFTSGRVIHGKGYGHKIGIPTINTDFEEGKIYPPFGVYESAVKIDGKLYPALTNVGTCPTFGGETPHAETYIINFDRDIYDTLVTVYYIKLLRGEIKFRSEEELLKQIEADKAEALSGDLEEKWRRIGLK
jgi:riboflavin kinase/FMN adenylyltransferase